MSEFPVANLDNTPEGSLDHPDGQRLRRWQLGKKSGGQEIGCSLVELPAGQASWPAHWHEVNEEAIYMLSGRARLRRGDEFVELKPGDYVAFVAGVPEAHQMQNPYEEPARYLCISTMIPYEIGHYPDGNTWCLITGSAPGGDKSQRRITTFLDGEAVVDYWKGEGEGPKTV